MKVGNQPSTRREPPGATNAAHRIAMVGLTSREWMILEFRSGAGTRYSLGEVGGVLGLSRERARQLQNVAIAKLNRNIESIAPPLDAIETYIRASTDSPKDDLTVQSLVSTCRLALLHNGGINPSDTARNG